MEKVERHLETIIALALAAIVLVLMSGCGGTTGWNVSFGVNPVTAVDNHQSLNTRESNYASKGEANVSAK